MLKKDSFQFTRIRSSKFIAITIFSFYFFVIKIFTHQREICPLKGCSLGLREEEDKVRLLAAVSRGHRTAVSQTTCNKNHENA